MSRCHVIVHVCAAGHDVVHNDIKFSLYALLARQPSAHGDHYASAHGDHYA